MPQNRRTYIATIGATLAGASLAGCGGLMDDSDDDMTDGGGPTPMEDDAADEMDWENLEAEIGATPDSVEIVESSLVETETGAAVIGTIRNTGDSPYSVLEVEVTLNDGDTILGEWIDTTQEEISDLAGGESWRFVAAFESENIYDATGYSINVNADVEDVEGDGGGDSS